MSHLPKTCELAGCTPETVSKFHTVVDERDEIEVALHRAIWRLGFQATENLERCTGQDARALAAAIAPVIRELVPCGAYREYGTPCSLATGHEGNHAATVTR